MDADARYCLKCGALLQARDLDGRLRAVCRLCGWVAYKQLKVGAGALILQDRRLLLLRRRKQPFQGSWNLPAGYVEANEAPARAAERETLEETGLQVQAIALVDAYYFDDDPRGNGILLVYDCSVLGGQLHRTEESSAWRFFLPAELPSQLAGGGHNQAINAWFERCGLNHGTI